MKKLLPFTTACLILALCTPLRAQPEDSAVMPPTDTRPDVVKVYVKQDPASYRRKQIQGSGISFSVQVSATLRSISEKSAEEEWDELGNVYVHRENGLYKVRIGPFETQQEAKQVLLGVKSKGRTDAFIVVQQSGENDAPIISTPSPSPPVNQSPEVHSTQPELVEGDYKVRVASYLHPGSFNPESIDQLGRLESYRKGDLTIMMIGGFRTLDEARSAKNAVIAKGFPDATIVLDNSGILETVEEK